ncbi:hypothetical protein QZH41_003621 [Actinostola sp. cb2023]|nr:hypothetical protein QZH41_003621 [Actinostola sp. cb2023]
MVRIVTTAVYVHVFAWFVCQVSTATNPGIQEILHKLNRLHASPQEPKGRPFLPLVSKPQPSQRIAIVGAGLAGLHMAYLLKKKGFANVVVLEKENRTGGKLLSVKHKGVFHDLGACVMESHTYSSVIALVRELGLGADIIHEQPHHGEALWLDNVSQPLSTKEFIILGIKRLTGAKDAMDAISQFLNATFRYTVLHRQMFGKYKYGLMNKPSKQVLAHLNQTFLSFLKQHELLALVPFLIVHNTMPGYGQLDTISALYGTIGNTPEVLYGYVTDLVGSVEPSWFLTFRNGFMELTDKLAEQVEVRLNVDIKKIQRNFHGIKIHFKNKKSEWFDFLIWSADARSAVEVMDSTTAQEKAFTGLTNTWLSTTVFESIEQCKPLPLYDIWMSNIIHKRENSVWLRRYSRNFIYSGNCASSHDDKTTLTTVAYQMNSKSSPKTGLLREKFMEHFVGRVGAENIDIINDTTWDYFYRFSVDEMTDGILWNVADYQGTRNTWYIGSSVCFEATTNVIEYNQLMMKRIGM